MYIMIYQFVNNEFTTYHTMHKEIYFILSLFNYVITVLFRFYNFWSTSYKATQCCSITPPQIQR